MGSQRGSSARLSLGLDNPTLIEPETPSKFTQDGTYSVEVDLWNASKDQPSMAADAIDKTATVKRLHVWHISYHLFSNIILSYNYVQV